MISKSFVLKNMIYIVIVESQAITFQSLNEAKSKRKCIGSIIKMKKSWEDNKFTPKKLP